MQLHNKLRDLGIGGKLEGFEFSLFSYTYATGSGKSRQSFDTEIMEIVLPRKLPHMVIDSLVEDGNGQASTLPINFSADQKLELEGDFYKYFSVYAPDDYAVSALAIIAPDVMTTLLDYAAMCDIEIIDDRLYFYWPDVPNREADYERIFMTTQKILQQIGHKLAKGDIFSTRSQAKLTGKKAQQEASLKVSYWGQVSVFILSALPFVLVLWMPHIIRKYNLPPGLQYGVAVIAIYGVVAARKIKHIELKRQLKRNYRSAKV